MPDFTVKRYGTDSSGRTIWMTTYMHNWWEARVANLGFRPTIVQGAFMLRDGGGAATSAGYHDQAGCFDVRTWDLTTSQVDALVWECRQHGAAAWRRDKTSAHGGMDPHCHITLGTDKPLSAGARASWESYLRGDNGLANNAPDYERRPSPLVTKPPKPPKPPATLTVLAWNAYVANTDANVRAALAGWVKAHNPDVIAISEARTHRAALQHVSGYTLFQEPPGATVGKVVDDQGDSAVLVRDDLAPDVKRHSVAKMRDQWVVVKHRRTHTPRRHEPPTHTKGGRKWRIRASHWPTNGFGGPNRSAFLESARRSKLWAHAGVGATSIDVGDLNDKKARVAAWFGKRFLVAGQGIDLLVARRAAKVEHTQLDKGGSDHHAQLYVVTAP